MQHSAHNMQTLNSKRSKCLYDYVIPSATSDWLCGQLVPYSHACQSAIRSAKESDIYNNIHFQ